MQKSKFLSVQRLAFSRSELALSIGVSVSSIDAMVAEGVLPQPRRWHTRKLWLVSEVEAYLNEWPTEGSTEVKSIDSLAWLNEINKDRSTLPPDPNQRERRALSELLAYEEGVWVHHSKIHCGIDTEQRLQERGFIKIKNQVKFPDRVDSYMLTLEGRKAARELGG
ncbi:helix-turn-helix transcriptional regulator [Georhizobium sp. MAB10]|uniref:helix-turn-helix transcriptional regulator n=1 Tax=Georhizobium sp. MAB10 TaxID=3028319 RepID=UPI003855B860